MTAARWTPVAFVAAGLTFLLFPLLRPWPDESVAAAELAMAFASDRWVVAHLCGILGLGLLAPALLGLRSMLADAARVTRAATWALSTAWVGAGLTALYFGAEIFGLRTIAQAALRENDLALLTDVEVLRMQPAAITLFGAGLALLAASGVLLAVALWRAGPLPRWAGVPLAIGLVLVLPQFFAPPGLRITHGILVAVGGVLAGVAVRRLGTGSLRQAALQREAGAAAQQESP